MKQNETKPPARFNEATLLSAMEGAGKLVEDEELREAMSANGLGTPATRLVNRVVWQAVDFLMAGLVFVLVGVELGRVASQVSRGILLPALAVVAATIVIRFLWMYAVPYAIRPVTSRDQPGPPASELTVLGWSGMRGVVTLAAAFALPILQRLLRGPRGHVRALILAPTRELAEQIHEAIGALGKRTGLRSTTIYGGVSIPPQIARLRAGVEIVVACPGRLLDLLGGLADLFHRFPDLSQPILRLAQAPGQLARPFLHWPGRTVHARTHPSQQRDDHRDDDERDHYDTAEEPTGVTHQGTLLCDGWADVGRRHRHGEPGERCDSALEC